MATIAFDLVQENADTRKEEMAFAVQHVMEMIDSFEDLLRRLACCLSLFQRARRAILPRDPQGGEH